MIADAAPPRIGRSVTSPPGGGPTEKGGVVLIAPLGNTSRAATAEVAFASAIRSSAASRILKGPELTQAARIRHYADLAGVPYEEMYKRLSGSHLAAPNAAANPLRPSAGEARPARRLSGSSRLSRGWSGDRGRFFQGEPERPVENLMRRHLCSRGVAEAALRANHCHAGLASRALSQQQRRIAAAAAAAAAKADAMTSRSVRSDSVASAVAVTAAESFALADSAPEAAAAAPDDEAGRRAEQQRIRRHHLSREVFDGERMYRRSVVALVDVYIRPLSEMVGGGDSQLLSAAASTLEDIAVCSAQLIGDMQAAVDAARSPDGDPGDFSGVDYSFAFLRLGPLLRLYTPFLAGYQVLIERLQEVTAQGPAQALVEGAEQELEREMPGDCSVFGMVILPIQRLMRYRLLLAELLRHAQHPDSHVDAATVAALESSLAEVSDQVLWCNEYCTASEKRREQSRQVQQPSSIFRRKKKPEADTAFFPDARRPSFVEVATKEAARLQLRRAAHDLSLNAARVLLARYWAVLTKYER